MKCGICGDEMIDLQQPQIALQEVKEEGKEFPKSVICKLIRIYSCDKCEVKSVTTESKEYSAPVVEEKI